MVAVAVVSVVNGSSSDAQTALETTVTREEIDAQAEALRFVHDSYIAGNGSDDTASKRYAEIWRAITSNANSASASILEYAPSDCRTLYEGTNSPVRQQKAFVLNTHNLRNGNANSVVLSAQNNSNLFKPAATYPRIIYNDSGDNLLAEDTGTTIQRAEGIYIVAVKDSNTTNIVTDKTHSTAASAYFDFYIRTCWYGPGAEHPSTISTVIRLYDPDAVSDVDSGDRVFSFHDEIVYGTAADDSGQSSGIASQIIPASNTQALRSGSSLDSTKWRFTAWCDKRVTRGSVCNGTQYASWTAPSWLSYNRQINMYPIFAEKFAKVVFYANDGTSTSKTQDKITIGVKTKLAANTFVYANHTFNGWCTVKMDVGKSCTGTKYSDGAEIKPAKEETFNLYAMWKRNFMTVAYNGNGATDGSMSDQKLYAGADGTLSKNKFTRTGYTFVGWCTTITSGSTCPSGYSYFDNQATITAGTIASWSGKTLKLFAIWKKIPSYTIYYNSNGGVGGIPSTTILAGEKTNIAYNNNRFTRANYVFWGWCTVKVNNNTGKCDGGTAYNEGKQVKAPADGGSLTLYAIWVPYSIEIIRGSAYVDGNGNRICTTDWTDTNYAGDAVGSYYDGTGYNPDYNYAVNAKNPDPSQYECSYSMKFNYSSSGALKGGMYTEATATVKALHDNINSGWENTSSGAWANFYPDEQATSSSAILATRVELSNGGTHTFNVKSPTKGRYNFNISAKNVDGKGACVTFTSVVISNPKKKQ